MGGVQLDTPTRPVDLLSADPAAQPHQRHVIQSIARREVDPVVLLRPTRVGGQEEVARVERLDALHRGPHLVGGQLVDCRVELVTRLGQRGRIVRRLEEPVLKLQARRTDEIQAVVDGVTAVAAMQERIHHAGIERQIRRD